MESKNCKRLKRDDADGVRAGGEGNVTVCLAVPLLEEQIPGIETCFLWSVWVYNGDVLDVVCAYAMQSWGQLVWHRIYVVLMGSNGLNSPMTLTKGVNISCTECSDIVRWDDASCSRLKSAARYLFANILNNILNTNPIFTISFYSGEWTWRGERGYWLHPGKDGEHPQQQSSQRRRW